MLTEKQIQDISNDVTLVNDLSDDDLVEFCNIANQRYRACLLYTSPSPRD